MDIIAVATTVGSEPAARSMAQELVSRRLAACAQISPIESFYWWKGAVHNDREYRILIKTSADRYAALEAAIRELHPYELPEIHAHCLDRVHEPYAAWVRDSVADA